ncbi:Gfo/Idh/MocA family protein [Paenibacillus flagellatus]|uniref:Gfo/Idh/MocA family oxidoreductase n=1 Tax=Paenibacillus flagellatus TaxID=2211139 RepID=A0A2V5KBZ3_9BACL|nr:Gfo/Idh/MocA family oxidoreductase [Paenibacillus flagellatus]PYI55443.1 gfo/Idh/MocA family oxidoreductase [Paenibacillus flagellatus]
MSHPQRKVRFAVVGCGGISFSHFIGIERAPEAELVAVCDANAKRAEEYGTKYGVKTYTDYDELLADPDVEVVCLCTPSGMHAEQTIRAAEAGKHIVCEKPMAIQLSDAERMVEACEEIGVKLAAIFPRRMSPSSQFVKKLVDDGKLGKLSLCSGYVKFYRDQAYYDSAGWRGTWAMDGGGAMMNQGIHTIDLLQWLAGPVASLHGYARNVLRTIEVEDTAVVSMQFKNGALGSIEATTTAYKQPDHRIVLHGDKGTIVLTGDEITTLDLIGEQPDIPAFPPFQVVPDGHAVQIRDMALAVLEDRQPIVTGRDGKHSLEIILGTYESHRSHREILFG